MADQPISFVGNETDADRDRIVLRSVLERGSCHYTEFHESARRYVWAMGDIGGRGLIRTHDRLATRFELTAAGHRRLAAVDPTYQAPPHSTQELERWNDPEALLCQIAALHGILARDIQRPEGAETIAPDVLETIKREAKRLADANRTKNE